MIKVDPTDDAAPPLNVCINFNIIINLNGKNSLLQTNINLDQPCNLSSMDTL